MSGSSGDTRRDGRARFYLCKMITQFIRKCRNLDMEEGGEGGDTGDIGTWVTSLLGAPRSTTYACCASAQEGEGAHHQGSSLPRPHPPPHPTRRDDTARVLIKLQVTHNQYAMFVYPILKLHCSSIDFIVTCINRYPKHLCPLLLFKIAKASPNQSSS